jgi:hypothetical protein
LELTKKTGRDISDEEVKNLLNAQGSSEKSMRRQMEREYLYREFVRFHCGPIMDKIGHADILEYYHGHPEEFQTIDGVQWQDIFLDATDPTKYPDHEAAHRFAEQLRARARGGEDFAKLALQYDCGISAVKNGQGEGHKRGEIRPAEAEPLLFRMRDGDVEVVELSSGYHVVRLVKREYNGQMPCDAKVQKQISEKLKNEVFQREAKQLIEDLRRKATIVREPAQQ